MSDDSNLNARLGRLAQQIPGMIRQLHGQRTKNRIITNGGPTKNLPCQVCGKPFGSPFVANRSPYCKRCRLMLKAGLCGFVTLAGTDGKERRWAIAALAGMPEDWKGKMRVVSNEEMDHIEKLIKDAPGKIEN